jgi:hypothetical protein
MDEEVASPTKRRNAQHEEDETISDSYEQRLTNKDEFAGHSWELLDQPLKTIGMDQLEGEWRVSHGSDGSERR